MKAEDWQGQIVSFYLEPAKAVDRGVILPGSVPSAGVVIGTFAVSPWGVGKIPDLGLLVRGRTGREARISIVGNYVERHKDYAQADGKIREIKGEEIE